MTRIFPLLLALASVPAFPIQPDGYEYKNCADQSSALPLEKCARIAIGSDLTSIMIRDVGKSDLPREDSSTSYLALQSKMLPLAVPKTNYAKVDKWTHGNYGYAKVATKISYSTWKNLDLVAATPRLDTDEATFEQNHLRFEAALTFWFSPESGVVAIAFPDRSSALADTYFCSRTPCLFAGGMVKP